MFWSILRTRMPVPTVKIVAAETEMRRRLTSLLCGIKGFEIAEHGGCDIVCIGCESQFPERDIATARALGRGARSPVLLITWQGSEELAVKAFRAGVDEYARGDSPAEEIAALLHGMLRSEAERPLAAGEMLVGDSAAIRSTRSYIERVARTACKVLITGETGTGKEVVANLLHRNSPRAHKPLICINCAAIPDDLLESELFGFERGAFTGANAGQPGKLKLADGGTVLFDEIGDMTPYAQAKILRMIESCEIQRLGSKRPEKIDLRILAATHCDLDNAEAHASFRRDLFFRLSVARIKLPPLRERKDDLLPLAGHFRLECNRMLGRQTVDFTPEAQTAILRHDWPGNVRELKNIIEAAFINLDARSRWVELPELFCRALENKRADGQDESARILVALAENHWNKSKAAESLHCSRMTLYRRMERCGIAADEGDTLAAKRKSA
jgi:DNA-binding NtrC family response regulator